MRDKAMPLGKKFKVRLTITPEETGTPVDMLGFTFTSGRNGRMELDTEYNNIPKLVDDGLRCTSRSNNGLHSDSSCLCMAQCPKHAAPLPAMRALENQTPVRVGKRSGHSLPFRLDLAPALGTRANPVKTHQSILSSKYSMSSQIEGMT